MANSQNQDLHEHHHRIEDIGNDEVSMDYHVHAAICDEKAHVEQATHGEQVAHEGHAGHE